MFNLDDWQRGVAQSKTNQYKETQLILIPVDGSANGSPQSPIQVNLAQAVSGLVVVPQFVGVDGSVHLSSLTATVFLRINGRGEWIPFSAWGFSPASTVPAEGSTRVAEGSSSWPAEMSYSGTIWKLEYFVSVPDNNDYCPYFALLGTLNCSMSAVPSSSGAGGGGVQPGITGSR